MLHNSDYGRQENINLRTRMCAGDAGWTLCKVSDEMEPFDRLQPGFEISRNSPV